VERGKSEKRVKTKRRGKEGRRKERLCQEMERKKKEREEYQGGRVGEREIRENGKGADKDGKKREGR